MTRAVDTITASIAATQPVLLRCQDRLWIKAHNSPIEITEAGCFADAVELLLAAFFVFNVQYPYHLKSTYEILETLCHICKAPSAVVAKELLRKCQL